MGKLDKQGVVTMQELLVSALAQSDALAKLLINKGLRGIHFTTLPTTHGGHQEPRVSKRAQARQTPPAEGACKTVCPYVATSGD